jgi:hypothetical protein
MSEPLLNCDEPYWLHLSDAVIALVPNVELVDRVVTTLDVNGVDVSVVRILQGDEGARIFDRTGAEHGLRARLTRFVENLGYDQETLSLYDEGVRKGESIVAVPSGPRESAWLGRMLADHEGHSVFYFGNSSAVSLTGP